MRKIVLLAVMVALAAMMLAAAPASAQDSNDEFCEDLDDDFICDFNEGAFFTGGITQETEQEAESGDIDQSFDVSQTGDNSNQTVGIQGVANTGNAQNVTDVVDAGDFGDFAGNDGFVVCDFDDDDRDGNEECEDIAFIFPFIDDGFFFDGFDGNGDVE